MDNNLFVFRQYPKFYIKFNKFPQRTMYDKCLKWPPKMNNIILLSFFVFFK